MVKVEKEAQIQSTRDRGRGRANVPPLSLQSGANVPPVGRASAATAVGPSGRPLPPFGRSWATMPLPGPYAEYYPGLVNSPMNVPPIDRTPPDMFLPPPYSGSFDAPTGMSSMGLDGRQGIGYSQSPASMMAHTVGPSRGRNTLHYDPFLHQYVAQPPYMGETSGYATLKHSRLPPPPPEDYDRSGPIQTYRSGQPINRYSSELAGWNPFTDEVNFRPSPLGRGAAGFSSPPSRPGLVGPETGARSKTTSRRVPTNQPVNRYGSAVGPVQSRGTRQPIRTNTSNIGSNLSRANYSRKEQIEDPLTDQRFKRMRSKYSFESPWSRDHRLSRIHLRSRVQGSIASKKLMARDSQMDSRMEGVLKVKRYTKFGNRYRRMTGHDTAQPMRLYPRNTRRKLEGQEIDPQQILQRKEQREERLQRPRNQLSFLRHRMVSQESPARIHDRQRYLVQKHLDARRAVNVNLESMKDVARGRPGRTLLYPKRESTLSPALRTAFRITPIAEGNEDDRWSTDEEFPTEPVFNPRRHLTVRRQSIRDRHRSRGRSGRTLLNPKRVPKGHIDEEDSSSEWETDEDSSS